MNRSLARTGNRIGVWMYRTLDGRLSGAGKDSGVLLLTVPGRRTGTPRSVCVRFVETDAGYVVWGTGGGSPKDPDWFENLRAARSAQVQLGSRTVAATARELHGEERDAVWRDVVLDRAPEVRRYADKAARTIPVAVLTPEG